MKSPLSTTRRPSRFAPIRATLAFASVCLAAVGAERGATPAPKFVGDESAGGVLVSTNQIVTPIGKVQRVDGVRPKDMVVSPDGTIVAVLTTSKVILYTPDGAVKTSIAVKPGPLGLAWQPDGQALYASGEDGMIHRIGREGDNWKATTFRAVDPAKKAKVFSAQDASPPSDAKETAGPRRKGDPQVAGLAVSPDGQRLYAALGISNAVSVLDLGTRQCVAVIPTGIAPYRIALSPDGKTLFSANRGGRPPRAGEASAPSAGTLVRVDPKTDAALRGSLSIIDTEKLTATEIEAGRQPSDLVFSADGQNLYVANSDEDTVSVFDTGKREFVQRFSVRPELDPGFGQIPSSLAISGDGRTLYVACGGANAIAALDLPTGKVSGYFPAGWYPIAVAERAGRLFIASSKGFGARYAKEKGFSVGGSVGTVQFVVPAELQPKSEHTRRVALNNGWGKSELPQRSEMAAAPIPERVGEPSLFKHVVFIIKENHTYDTTLGDIPQGNGDPKLCMFGEEVTPNQHAIARQWVLLDNTFTSGTNSADGHQWTVSGAANGYMEQNYAAHSRSYPYDGGDPLAYSPEGFLWNSAVKAGKTVRVYGEFVNKPKVVDKATGKTPTWKELWDDYQAGGAKFTITAGTDNAALRPHLHPNYIGFPTVVSDQWRADQYLADLKGFEATGGMPALSILLLPNDHTTGTKPNFPTPRAAVADNDLALGRIVEALTHSRFWKETLILVIEDDSQLGTDHVDGHRTIAFCVSPYTRRGAVVSEVYNHTSFIRTMGLVLGLPAMNRFDRTATPMTACFADKLDETPFTHLANRVPLDELNPPLAALRGERKRLALACTKLDWSDVDRADSSVVARAVWQVQRPGEPFPWKSFNLNVKDDD